MNAHVTVVDYGSGNLLSVARALEYCGAQVEVTAEPSRILAAERLLLPGVGAFADGFSGLEEGFLVDPIKSFACSGRPLLGICLGMQFLASVSEEFGRHVGLDLVPGQVRAIPERSTDGERLKSPHIGWADLVVSASGAASRFGIRSGDAVYLVHSYRFEPANQAHCIAECFYGGHSIVAAIHADNITGFQFHPEKSGKVGLRILDAFLYGRD